MKMVGSLIRILIGPVILLSKVTAMTFSAEDILAPSTRNLALSLWQLQDDPVLMRGGVGWPEGALYLTAAKLVLCSTVCDAPMSRKPVIKACADMRRDAHVLAIPRTADGLGLAHGCYDEELIHTGGQSINEKARAEHKGMFR